MGLLGFASLSDSYDFAAENLDVVNSSSLILSFFSFFIKLQLMLYYHF